jgi:hypothetical protein
VQPPVVLRQDVLEQVALLLGRKLAREHLVRALEVVEPLVVLRGP